MRRKFESGNQWSDFAIVDRRWADYAVTDRKSAVVPAPIVQVTFADGETVRAPFATSKGQPLNIGRGLRTAIAFYRARIARRCHRHPIDDGRGFCIDVPAITACSVIQSAGESLPLFPRTMSDATAKLRRGTFSLARVKEEARERHIPLLTTGGLDQAQLIARRYQRAAARYLLAHPELLATYRAIGSVEDVRRIAVAKDLDLNQPRTPVGTARNQYMARPKGTWRNRKAA
ncbi:MAG: hypothetical protein E6G97_25885 [Alphaproteobacteria bacterium]|nr:MAG: hypothetical protein E6G97_25885 [Alphaproteobacteria bacterium]